MSSFLSERLPPRVTSLRACGASNWYNISLILTVSNEKIHQSIPVSLTAGKEKDKMSVFSTFPRLATAASSVREADRADRALR
jgi:hypothetical protein